MVGTVILFALWCFSGWAFNRFGKKMLAEIAILQRENVQLAKTAKAYGQRLAALESRPEKDEDHEVRIALLENSLTAKTSEAKIVPKATKPNWKTFRTAAEKATEPQETE